LFLGTWSKTKIRKKIIHDKFLTETIPQMLPGLNKLLKENTTGSGFWVGKSLTMADYVVCSFGSVFLLHKDRIGLTQAALEANPEIHAYLKSKLNDEFKDYLEKRKHSFI